MRKHQQEKIFTLLKTLNEALGEAYKQTDREVAANLLAVCRKISFGIGQFIEELGRAGTQTGSLLAEFCELLVKAGDGGISEKALRKHLTLIKNTVRTELKPNRIEVVFFPYQLSMFDSLESIYLAAKADPDCDAYVVPIPYYELNPDGTFGKMRYDGRQYPKNIPVFDWRRYDIETRRPDVVFTHNPYDDGNCAARVHANFYNRQLKKFTDLLCYVPYFVCPGDVDEHFCINAGTIYADKVIVQSEKIRQTYIRFFKEFEKKNNCTGRFGKAEDKFVALGSPKFDKVINSKPEDFTLPGEWQKLIEKPNGTRKKPFSTIRRLGRFCKAVKSISRNCAMSLTHFAIVRM